MSMPTHSFVLILSAWSALSGATRQAANQLKVEADPENVLASRLEGKWQVDAELTRKLGGKVLAEKLEFRRDDKVLERIPEAVAARLKGERIYLAGIMVMGGREHPFLLTGLKGNPHVVWLREGNAKPGDAESCNVMLARAAQSDNDLLFTGSDHNNQPFAAYAREVAGGAVDARSVPVQLKAVIADMARLLAAKKHAEFIRTYAAPDDLNKMTESGRSVEAIAEGFAGDKAELLLKILESAQGAKPVLNTDETEATYPGQEEGRPLRLQRVEKRWYLRN